MHTFSHYRHPLKAPERPDRRYQEQVKGGTEQAGVMPPTCSWRKQGWICFSSMVFIEWVVRIGCKHLFWHGENSLVIKELTFFPNYPLGTEKDCLSWFSHLFSPYSNTFLKEIFTGRKQSKEKKYTPWSFALEVTSAITVWSVVLRWDIISLVVIACHENLMPISFSFFLFSTVIPAALI